MKEKNKEDVYKEYNRLTNMNFEELLKWSNDHKSKAASLKPGQDSSQAIPERRKLRVLAALYKIKLKDGIQTALIRNLVLKKAPKRDWDDFIASQALKAINYIKRAKKIKGKWNNNKTALKNWAYNSRKK